MQKYGISGLCLRQSEFSRDGAAAHERSHRLAAAPTVAWIDDDTRAIANALATVLLKITAGLPAEILAAALDEVASIRKRRKYLALRRTAT